MMNILSSGGVYWKHKAMAADNKGVFIDLYKGFSPISHSLLLQKMWTPWNKRWGTGSHLTSRFQCVKMKDDKSDLRRVTFGLSTGT